MFDFIIYIAIIFLIFFSYLGLTTNKYFFTAFGTVISILIGIGLFTSGWQTYDVPNFVVTESGSITTIVGESLQILPSISGSAEQQLIFAFATFFVLLSIVFISIVRTQRNESKYLS